MMGRVGGVEEALGRLVGVVVSGCSERSGDSPELRHGHTQLAPVGAAIRSASADARSAASASPRMPAIAETMVSAAAFQSGWPSSIAKRLASSAAGIATSQLASRVVTIPCTEST